MLIRHFPFRYALLSLAASCLFAPAMQAGVVMFTATGSTQNSSTLSGTVGIDTALGTVSSVNLTLTGTYSFTVTQSATGLDLGDFLLIANNGTIVPALDLLFPVGSLVGYTGGGICSVAVSCAAGGSVAAISGDSTAFNSASLTESSAVPEPASVALVGSAVLGLVAWRRRKKAL